MAMEITEAQRAHLIRISRMGGQGNVASAGYTDSIVRARKAHHDSYLQGHSCKVCKPVVFAADISDDERERRAAAARRLHYTRMAHSRWGYGLRGGEGTPDTVRRQGR